MNRRISRVLLAITASAALASTIAWSQDEPFIGTVRYFGFDFTPRGWAACDGQLLAINQNDALFSLLGTFYGGDGRTTFGLPDMRGRIPLHAGSGPGLTPRSIGQKGGTETVTLTADQIGHSHTLQASTSAGNQSTPTGHTLAGDTGDNTYLIEAPSVAMNGASISATQGGGSAHENRPPSLAVNCVVALFGIYPSRQ